VHRIVARDQAGLALALRLRAADRAGLEAVLEVLFRPPLERFEPVAALGKIDRQTSDPGRADFAERRGLEPGIGRLGVVAVDQRFLEQAARRGRQVGVGQGYRGIGFERGEGFGKVAITCRCER
jgi:hypothetical protein